jgi:hypothetical protein
MGGRQGGRKGGRRLVDKAVGKQVDWQDGPWVGRTDRGLTGRIVG